MTGTTTINTAFVIAVPEPAAWILVVLGLAVVVRRRSRA
jgi:hypothetical protein